MNTIIIENEISYVLSSDGMYYHALIYDTAEPHYGKYGLLRKQFLQEHHKGYYTALLLHGKLTEHLNQIDDAANAQMELITKQMAKMQGVTEALKAQDQFAWVDAMNNIRNAAEEIVLTELIYA